MKKILLFLLLIPILASCEQDYTKYKLVDHSTQTKINNHIVSIGKRDSIRYYAIASTYDEILSGSYLFKDGDELYIYEHDNKFIASHVNVTDLGAIREYMRNYTKERIENGIVIWIIIALLFLLAIPCAKNLKNNIGWVFIFVAGIEIFIFCYTNTDTGLEYSNLSGLITQVDKNMVTLENNKHIPLYSNCDIIRKQNIDSGNYIHIYSYKDTFFPSLKKLPVETKTHTMFYPHTHLYYSASALALFIFFVFALSLIKLSYLIICKKVRKKNNDNKEALSL